MRSIYILLICCCNLSVRAQTFNLPARQSSALEGSAFVNTIRASSITLAQRETLIYNQVSSGNVPDFIRNLKPVTSTATINSMVQSVTFYVLPDYLAIGSDSNYFLCPMSPMLATKIADLTGCTLPTRKMVNNIWSAAAVKLAPQPITASAAMTTVPVFDDHNTLVKNSRTAVIGSLPLGALVSGDKKDVVISNQIYTTTNRVIIYGWHQTNGSAIQPLSSVHGDTYMDYSHGIRLVQNAVSYNGNTTSVKNILASTSLNALLSDEGVIATPYYPYSTTLTPQTPVLPTAIAYTISSGNKIKFSHSNITLGTHFVFKIGFDGVTFPITKKLPISQNLLAGMILDTAYYLKVQIIDSINNLNSNFSEVLCAFTALNKDSILIVNAFDRPVVGNDSNYCKEFANALRSESYNFVSCNNEAIISGLINLNQYKNVFYILGEESTLQETFSSSEQSLIVQYLDNGGHLMVSGSEIAWDLDKQGSTADKLFFNTYLKSKYIQDAPNNLASTFYNSLYVADSNNCISGSDSISFDNGTNGTYNVRYPDVLKPIGGANAFMHYENSDTAISGICFQGMASSNAIKESKIVYMGFPFETIVQESKRNLLLKNVMTFFGNNTSIINQIHKKELAQSIKIYPNPTKNSLWIEGFEQNNFTLEILDVRMRKFNEKLNEGNNGKTYIDVSEFNPGIYILKINDKTNKNNYEFKFVVLP